MRSGQLSVRIARLLARRAELVAVSLALAAFVLVSCSLTESLTESLAALPLAVRVLPLAVGVVALVGLGAGIRRWPLAALSSTTVAVATFMLCAYVFGPSTPEDHVWTGFWLTVLFAGPPSALLGAAGAVAATRALRSAR